MTGMMSPFIGEVRAFAAKADPPGWLLCDGKLYAPTDPYTALFAIISNRFGGDGKKNFAVPDFRGCAPLGVGQGPGLTLRKLADTVGSATVLASAEHFPTHTHSVIASAGDASTGSGASASLAKSGTPGGGGKLTAINIYADAAGTPVKMAADALTTTGTNTAHNNMQPHLPAYFYICYSGVYPTRPD